jgi:uncharacterized damage-inducible protein DinB
VVSMNEELLFNQLYFVRSLTMKAFKSIPENKLDVIPDGAANNLRWHLGHIYTAQSLLISKFAGYETNLPNNYITFFAPKTAPVNWTKEPPKINEIRTLLEQQPEEVERILKGRVDEQLKKPFLTGTHGEFTTVQEIVTFAIYHEGHHLGAINALKRIVGVSF